jgi:hypothetical protein
LIKTSNVPVTESYVRRKYEKWTRFWDYDFPPWSDVDLVFSASNGEWGSVTWLDDGEVRISLDPLCRKYYGLARSVLFHEMNHLYLGPKIGHGKRFNRSLLEALNRGGIFEGVI